MNQLYFSPFKHKMLPLSVIADSFVLLILPNYVLISLKTGVVGSVLCSFKTSLKFYICLCTLHIEYAYALLTFIDAIVLNFCRNDELISTMSWVGFLLTNSELFILFAENSQILLKISVVPILLTFMCLVALNQLVNNQLNSSLRQTKKQYANG